MDKYLMFGPQGSGKSTQSRLLAARYDFVHISVGEILRWHVEHRTKLGSRVRRIVESGRLVPDETVQAVVQDRLREHDWNYGLVLDGFPRNLAQARFLRESWNFDRVIHLDVPDEVVSERVLTRARAGWGGGFTKRADDNPKAVRMRIRQYHELSVPLLEIYRRWNMLVHIEGTLPISEVFSRITYALRLR
jgi:adenylate kinase